MKEETFRQKQIFEIYYSMQDRSLEKLRELLLATPEYAKNTPSIDTLKSWSKKYSWQLRIEQRDIENAKSLEKKINETIVDEKVEIRKIIKANMNILKQAINDYIQQNRVVEIKTLSDVNTLANILDKLSRLEMDLVGENLSNEWEALADKISKRLNGNDS